MKQQNDVVVNPIYHFDETDIWQYINDCHIKTNPLYECGYRRVGCIGCPMATYKQKIKEFSDYPKYKALYIKAFDRMMDERRKIGKGEVDPEHNRYWNDGQSVFDWWIEEYKHNVKGQIDIFSYMEEQNKA